MTDHCPDCGSQAIVPDAQEDGLVCLECGVAF